MSINRIDSILGKYDDFKGNPLSSMNDVGRGNNSITFPWGHSINSDNNKQSSMIMNEMTKRSMLADYAASLYHIVVNFAADTFTSAMKGLNKISDAINKYL